MYKYVTKGRGNDTERQSVMEKKKESKLQHILKTSWESEQMPGWEDSLSIILEATKKEYQKKNKDTLSQNTIMKPLKQEMPELQEEISM